MTAYMWAVLVVGFLAGLVTALLIAVSIKWKPAGSDAVIERIAQLEKTLTEEPAFVLDNATLNEMPHITKLRDYYLKKLTASNEVDQMHYYKGVVMALNTIVDLPNRRKRELAEEEAQREEEEEQEQEDGRRANRRSGVSGRGFTPRR